MLDVKLDADGLAFVEDQVARGRYRDAEEVIAAGLSLLKREDDSLRKRLCSIRDAVTAALDDPRPSVPAEEVFERLERKQGTRATGLRGA